MATAPSLGVNATTWIRGADARVTGSASPHKAPISPSSSSSRMTAESCVNVLFDDDAEDRREVMAAAGVEELIDRLPDALFGFDDDAEELTPFKAVYGSAPDRSPPDFGGRGALIGGARRQSMNLVDPGKYTPPNRLNGGVPPRSPPRRNRRESNRHQNPKKNVNPAPGFNGAGFRSVREIYSSKVHDYLCAKAIEGSPWVTLVKLAIDLEKPLTVPENYAKFFKSLPEMFELSMDGKYVAAKLPGEDHAAIPPPPGSSISSGQSSPAELSSSPASDEFTLVTSRKGRRTRNDAQPQARSLSPGSTGSAGSSGGGSASSKPCQFLSKPGGCRMGDACRFSHDLGDSSGKPPRPGTFGAAPA